MEAATTVSGARLAAFKEGPMEDVRAISEAFWETRSERKAWMMANGAMTLTSSVSDHLEADRENIGAIEGSGGGRRMREDSRRLCGGVRGSGC